MGCTASHPENLISKTNEPLTTSRNLSLLLSSSSSSPLVVHHHPSKKGDTHHLVSLTSTTYGSLLLIDSTDSNSNSNNPNPRTTKNPNFSPSSSPDSVINTWELMAGLDEFDYSKPNKSSIGSVVVDDYDYGKPKPNKSSSSSSSSSSSIMFDRSFSCNSSTTKKMNLDKEGLMIMDGKVKKLCNSFEAVKRVVVDKSNSSSNLNTKPLWKHLSEESLLADMDPNVASSFRRAISVRQLGFNNNNNNNNNSTKTMMRTTRVSNLGGDDRVRLKGTEDRIVIFFTSLRGIRRTYEDCCAVRTIIRGFRVRVDERDISMDSAYRKELQTALGEKTVNLPRVFIRGKYIGGAEEIKQLHEVGELGKLLEGFPLRDIRLVCDICGDARFVPCLNCNGSRKIFMEDEEQLRRCPDCNENGLIRCPTCCH